MRWALLILVLTTPAWAQPWYPPPPPPPPPAYAVPTYADIDALEHAAQRKILTGNILIGTGGALAAAGTGLLLGSFVVDDKNCVDCTNKALGLSGGLVLAAGVGALIPGLFVRASGRRDLALSRALRRAAALRWQF
jgi:hypothetical protein